MNGGGNVKQNGRLNNHGGGRSTCPVDKNTQGPRARGNGGLHFPLYRGHEINVWQLQLENILELKKRFKNSDIAGTQISSSNQIEDNEL